MRSLASSAFSSSLPLFCFALFTAVLCWGPLEGIAAGPSIGEAAPVFSLEDTAGKVYDLSNPHASLLILYFCDLDSKPNREGLMRLKRLAHSYQSDQLQIWAISGSRRERAQHVESEMNLGFPLLLDTKGVSDLYNARIILPTLYAIDHGTTIIDIFRGTGTTTEEQLKRLIAVRLAATSKGDDQSFDGFKRRGIQAYDEKRLEDASRDLSRALALRPDQECYQYLAHTWIEMGKDSKAEETLDAAIAAYPDDPRFHQTYVEYLLARHNVDRAQSGLDRALRQFPGDHGLLALKKEVEQATRNSALSHQGRSLPPPPIKKSVETPDQKARSLFNLARQENPRLSWDACLAKKALARAESMVRQGNFEHKDPKTGKNPAWDLVKACHKAASAGENLSRGEGQSSRSIHTAFMQSSSHRKNILDSRFSLMGVGCHETICVELFAGF